MLSQAGSQGFDLESMKKAGLSALRHPGVADHSLPLQE